MYFNRESDSFSKYIYWNQDLPHYGDFTSALLEEKYLNIISQLYKGKIGNLPFSWISEK